MTNARRLPPETFSQYSVAQGPTSAEMVADQYRFDSIPVPELGGCRSRSLYRKWRTARRMIVPQAAFATLRPARCLEAPVFDESLWNSAATAASSVTANDADRPNHRSAKDEMPPPPPNGLRRRRTDPPGATPATATCCSDARQQRRTGGTDDDCLVVDAQARTCNADGRVATACSPLSSQCGCLQSGPRAERFRPVAGFQRPRRSRSCPDRTTPYEGHCSIVVTSLP